MALPAAKKRYTVEEYLRLEEQAAERHEFHDGEILAMSGGTYEHSTLNANLIRIVGNQLVGSPCRVLDSNMRVAIRRASRYVYPDASIVCGRAEFDPDDPNRTTILNPRVVIEVLSPSTEGYDRGEKFNWYETVDALSEYVLIPQDRPTVETFVRQADGRWLRSAWTGLGAVADLAAVKVRLPLSELYAGVDFGA